MPLDSISVKVAEKKLSKAKKLDKKSKKKKSPNILSPYKVI
jgi:hypothetical protein